MTKSTNAAATEELPGGLTLKTLGDLEAFAEKVVDSPFFPPSFYPSKAKPEDARRLAVNSVCVALQYGAELGLSPVQSLQNLAVINGKASIYGDAMLALCVSSKHWDHKGWSESISDDGQSCTVTVRRLGGNTHTVIFAMDDAKKAGLIGKGGPWQQYPKRMLQMRARGFALRDVFPDVLKGLKSAEERMDEPEVIDVASRPAMTLDDLTKPNPAAINQEAPKPHAPQTADSKSPADVAKPKPADSPDGPVTDSEETSDAWGPKPKTHGRTRKALDAAVEHFADKHGWDLAQLERELGGKPRDWWTSEDLQILRALSIKMRGADDDSDDGTDDDADDAAEAFIARRDSLVAEFSDAGIDLGALVKQAGKPIEEWGEADLDNLESIRRIAAADGVSLGEVFGDDDALETGAMF
jgi:hypothetical protein